MNADIIIKLKTAANSGTLMTGKGCASFISPLYLDAAANLIEDLQSKLNVALRAQAERDNPQPLTLEQLKEREKNGKGIYVCNVDGSAMFRGNKYTAAVLDKVGTWGVIGLQIEAIYGRSLTLTESDYMITWLAYDHEPKEV